MAIETRTERIVLTRHSDGTFRGAAATHLITDTDTGRVVQRDQQPISESDFAAEWDRALVDVTAERDSLITERDQLQADLDTVTSERDSLKTTVDNQAAEIVTLKQTVSDQQATITDLESRVPPEPGPREITRPQFLARFTEPELITLATSDHDAAAVSRAALYTHEGFVDLDSQRLTQFLDGLIAAGLISQSRADELRE